MMVVGHEAGEQPPDLPHSCSLDSPSVGLPSTCPRAIDPEPGLSGSLEMEEAGQAESHALWKARVVLPGISPHKAWEVAPSGRNKDRAEPRFCERLTLGRCGLRGGWWTGTLTSYLH